MAFAPRPTGSVPPAQIPATGEADPVPKYVVIGGIRRLNPEYKKRTTLLVPQEALPVVSNMKDYEAYNAASTQEGMPEVPLAPTSEGMIDHLQRPEIARQAGAEADTLVDRLGALCSQHEIPMGLTYKLLGFREFDYLHGIVDDSGSMGSRSDSKDSRGFVQSVSRWEEARDRLKIMVQILAHVPTPPLRISFLCRGTKLLLERREGENLDQYIARAHYEIDREFRTPPTGAYTPVVTALRRSFAEGEGRKVMRYLFCDGIPNESLDDQKIIKELLMNRKDPANNPVSLLSCTNNDADVEWMKVVEEVAPFCSESDDFASEAQEVLRDQGPVLPYTYGFHLICELTAAMNPDDLDALDESVPLTKQTLDNLLGVVGSDAEYSRYFDGFLQAQGQRKIKDQLGIDKFKKAQNWRLFYTDFLSAPVAEKIPAVREFKKRLEALAGDQ